MRQVFTASEVKVWSAYIHKVKRIIRCRDMLDLIQQEMAPFDPHSSKTLAITKQEVDRLKRPFEIFQNVRIGP